MIIKINRTTTLKFRQIYAPTSNTDEDVEALYKHISRCTSEYGSSITIILDDFNAEIGQNNDDMFMGEYGLGTRNE